MRGCNKHLWNQFNNCKRIFYKSLCSGVYICFDILILEIGILFSTFDKGLNVGLRNEKMRQK